MLARRPSSKVTLVLSTASASSRFCFALDSSARPTIAGDDPTNTSVSKSVTTCLIVGSSVYGGPASRWSRRPERPYVALLHEHPHRRKYRKCDNSDDRGCCNEHWIAHLPAE